MEEIDECQNVSGNLSTTKVREHVLSGFSMSTIPSFKNMQKSMIHTEVKIV